MPDLRSQLSSSLGGYSIERELGGGGMARVFLAIDKALNRPVVIKVLTPELAAHVSTKRFEREIRVAATLQHANIVPVLSAGETDGMPHYTMPYVEGQSLRDLLKREGRLGIAQTVSILRDVGRALAYAHERGVVHRDIKPENVLLSGDAAVVTDFGIAKAIANARRADDGETAETPARSARESTVTQIGSAVGTPAYMSPEQISGDPEIDHRADIYSFGCLAYEILTGKAPFEGRSPHSLFAAHLSEAPVPIGEKRPETPLPLARTVMQCLEKDAARRPPSARAILSALEGIGTSATGFDRLLQRLTHRQRIGIAIATAAIAAIAAAGQWRAWRNARDAVSSVAVVPFVNAGDSTGEYLADGIADGLATALGKLQGVRVVSRSASYHYKGKRDATAHDIGVALSASHVLQGSLRRVDGRLRVSAQLASARDNREVWADTYDRAGTDLLAVPDEITRSIVAGLRGRLASGAPTSTARSTSGTSNADAYDLYLRGRFFMQRRAVRQAAEKFAQAIRLDSGFARAYAALAFSVELLVYFEPIRTDSVGSVAIAAAHRALELDSTLAEAHTALGLAYQHAYDWPRAEAEHQLAVSLEPSEADAHIQYGRLLHCTGRSREAEVELRRARDLDPFSAAASGWVGHMLDLRGRTADGLVEMRRALEIDSTNPPSLFMFAETNMYAGNHEAARAAAEQLWRRVPGPGWRSGAAMMLAHLGEPSRARVYLRELDTHQTTPFVHVTRATLFAGLGDTSAFITELERATAAREPWPTWYSICERLYDPIRRSDRFRSVVRNVHLDEHIFTSSNCGGSRRG